MSSVFFVADVSGVSSRIESELTLSICSVAISNSRLIRADAHSVTFRVKDYRVEGAGRHKTMTLDTAGFIRRFSGGVRT